MEQKKRILAFLFTLCIMLVWVSPIPACALDKELDADITHNSDASDRPDNSDEAEDKDKEDSLLITTGAAIDLKTTDSAIDVTTGGAIKKTTPAGIETKDKKPQENTEELWFRKQNPMKKEHQKLLWEYCRKRNINYVDMLALIYTESNFIEKSSTGKYYGYFQISKGNCANLAATLKTPNKPLDGAININWGTALYSWILADERVKGLEGKKKRDVALSIYQRGTGGYDKYGISTSFLKVYYKKWEKVSDWFEK